MPITTRSQKRSLRSNTQYPIEKTNMPFQKAKSKHNKNITRSKKPISHNVPDPSLKVVLDDVNTLAESVNSPASTPTPLVNSPSSSKELIVNPFQDLNLQTESSQNTELQDNLDTLITEDIPYLKIGTGSKKRPKTQNTLPQRNKQNKQYIRGYPQIINRKDNLTAIDTSESDVNSLSSEFNSPKDIVADHSPSESSSDKTAIDNSSPSQADWESLTISDKDTVEDLVTSDDEETVSPVQYSRKQSKFKNCLEGKIRNPKTNRCKKVKLLKDCLEGKSRNPKTNRCKKDLVICENGDIGSQCYKKFADCATGKFRNPLTHRCKNKPKVFPPCAHGKIRNKHTNRCAQK